MNEEDEILDDDLEEGVYPECETCGEPVDYCMCDE